MFRRSLWSLAAALLMVGFGAPARATVLVPGETDAGVNLVRMQVQAMVHGRGAQTVLNLTFTNHGAGRNAQATVLFPVPEGAAVQRLRLKIGDSWMEGEVTGRVQGRQVYDNLRRRTVDPALLEQAGEDLYRLRVFPIPTGGTTEVEIVYWHVLPEDDGRFFYELPFDIAGDRRAPARAPLALTLYCGGLGKARVDAPADWPGAGVKASGQSVTVTCPERAMDLAGTVRVAIAPKSRPELLLAHRAGGGDGSFYLQVNPDAGAAHKAVPRRFVFCLDRSGSMQGTKIAQAREALAGCISALRDIDSFNIVLFSSTVETFTRQMEPAAEMRKSAGKFVADIAAYGSTDIRGAVLAALGLDSEGREPLDVILISDGQQTIGASTAEAVLGPVKDAAAARKAPVRISVVGIGADVDAALLRAMAGTHEGEAAFVTAEHAVAGQIDAVLARLQSLRRERLTVEVSGAGAELVTPGYFAALPLEKPVIVAGNYKGAGRLKVRLSWDEGARKRSWEESCELPAGRDDYRGVPVLLGAAYVDALEAEITRTASEESGVRQIVEAGTVYRLVTRYTSLIALETDVLYVQQGVARPERDALGIARKAVPVNVEVEKRFGPATGGDGSGQQQGRQVAAIASPQPAAIAPAQPPAAVPQRPAAVALRDPGPSAPARDIRMDTYSRPPAQTAAPQDAIQSPAVMHEKSGVADSIESGMDKRTAPAKDDAISDMALGGTGKVGSLGVGGGGSSGVFGYRDGGGRKKAVGRFGGSPATEEAVEAALAWLARHQEADGSWDAKKFGATAECRGEATGLAVLAFLGAGYTQKSGRYADNVARALAWISARQDGDAGFKVDDAEALRAQAVLTLAVSEACGMQPDADLRAVAQRAVDRCQALQKKYSGWGRREGAAPDTLTTAWFVAALKSARVAGLKVDGAAFQGASAYLDKVRSDGSRGYCVGEGSKAPDPASTMAGSVCSILMGGLRGEALPGVRWAAGKVGARPDPEALYFGTLVCFQVGGDDWRSWNDVMKKMLLDGQARGGALDGSEKDTGGSWAPEGAAAVGGRVASTALSALCLEAYYRYLPMYAK